MKRGKEKTQRNVRAGLRHDTRGAVLAEFVVALVPLLTIFFVFVQLSAIAAARLRVKHAAVCAARAAAVFSNVRNNVPEMRGANGRSEIQSAVTSALGSVKNQMAGVSVTVTDRSTRDDPYDLVTVTVTARYQCQVPLGKIICPGGVKTMVDRKSMPHQGARYKLD